MTDCFNQDRSRVPLGMTDIVVIFATNLGLLAAGASTPWKSPMSAQPTAFLIPQTIPR